MRRSIIAFFLSVSLTAAAGAGAQDDPRKVQAAPFFEEGRKLAEKGQNADSLDRFKRAFAIYPSPNTLFNVARQEHLLGRRLDAIRDYRAALKNAVLLPAVADLARTYVAELERVLARLKVLGPEGARVTVAGAEYALPMAEPVDVEPGTIAVTGSSGGEHYAASAEVLAGSLAMVTVGPKPASTPSAAPPVEDHADPTTAAGSNTTRNVVAGSLMVVGLVGIGLGVGFTVAANGSSDDLAKARTNAGPNADQACATAATPECQARASAADDLVRNTNVARAMFIGGGAAVVGGAVAFLVWPKAKNVDATSGARLSPWVGSGTLGLSYGRNF
jgi:hypothetical protein